MTFTLKRGVENLTQRRKNYEFDVLKVAKFLSNHLLIIIN